MITHKKLILLLLILLPIEAFAIGRFFFGGGVGLGTYQSEKMKRFSLEPKGGDHGLVVGVRAFPYVDVSLEMRKGKEYGDLTHNSITYKLLHEQSYLGARVDVLLGKTYFFTTGIYRYTVNHSFKNDPSAGQLSEIEQIYDLKYNESFIGFPIGLGVNLVRKDRGAFYASYTRFLNPSYNGSFTSVIEVGFRYYLPYGSNLAPDGK